MKLNKDEILSTIACLQFCLESITSVNIKKDVTNSIVKLRKQLKRLVDIEAQNE